MPTPEEEGNTSDEDRKKSDRRIIPKEVEQRKMASNPPTYVKIFNMVKRCSGCRLLFDDIHRKPPNDLVFRYRMRRGSSKQGSMEGSRQDRKCLLSLSGSSLSSQSTGTGNIDTGWDIV